MSIQEFTLPIDEQKKHYDLCVSAGALIFDAEPRYGAGLRPEVVHLLASVEDREGDEVRRFALLDVDAAIPDGWTDLERFDGKQFVMMDEPLPTPVGMP